MSQHVRDMLDGAEYGHTGSSMRWIPPEGDRWAANPRPPVPRPQTFSDEYFSGPAVAPAGRVWTRDTSTITREQLAAAFDVPFQPVQPIFSLSFTQHLEAAWPAFQESMARFAEAVVDVIRPLQELAERLGATAPPRDDVRAHALWAAQHRNTGPDTIPATQQRRPRRHAHEPVDRPPPRRARARRRA